MGRRWGFSQPDGAQARDVVAVPGPRRKDSPSDGCKKRTISIDFSSISTYLAAVGCLQGAAPRVLRSLVVVTPDPSSCCRLLAPGLVLSTAAQLGTGLGHCLVCSPPAPSWSLTQIPLQSHSPSLAWDFVLYCAGDKARSSVT